jgi:transposase-like protein
MSRKERGRLELASQVKADRITLVKAAGLMGMSYRQAKRVYRRYVKDGDAGLVHKLRGRASNRKTDATKHQEVLGLYRDKYAGFGLTLACEYMARDGHEVAVSTLRGWLMGAGLWSPRRRRRKHRRWRERKEHRGEMVQMDGSHHDWFEGRGDACVLMVMIDDATGWTHAMFFESETTVAAMTVFKSWVECHGLPRSLYVDKDSIYRTTREATADESLENTGALTQFGRAMKDLDVELICAHSPQAKGRVERMNGTLQDRLVKAMRLEGIGDIAAANKFLADRFLPQLNERFTVKPDKAADLHRAVGAGLDLEQVLSHQEQRVMHNDWCVTWQGRWFQVLAQAHGQVRPGSKLTVRVGLDGSVDLVYRGRALAFKELPARPERIIKERLTLRERVSSHRPPWKPPAHHPYKRRPAVGGSNERSRLQPCSAPVGSPTARQPALRKAATARDT